MHLSPYFFCALWHDVKLSKEEAGGVPSVAQWKWLWLVSRRMLVPSLALLSGLRIRCCWELWWRSQVWLRPSVAVAVEWAGSSSFSYNSTSSLGTSVFCGWAQKQKKKKKKKKKKRVLKYHMPVISGIVILWLFFPTNIPSFPHNLVDYRNIRVIFLISSYQSLILYLKLSLCPRNPNNISEVILEYLHENIFLFCVRKFLNNILEYLYKNIWR